MRYAASEFEKLTYPGESDQPYCLAWSPDGKYLVIGDNAQPTPAVKVWRVEESGLSPLSTYSGHRDEVSCVAWSPDGRRIASGGLDGIVQVWEAETARQILTYRGHVLEGIQVLAVAWSPDGQVVASSEGGPALEYPYAVQVWEAETARQVFTYRDHSAACYALAWSPDGTRLASGSYDSSLHVWEWGSGKRSATYRHPGWIHAASWSPDGTRIAVALDDFMVQIWDVLTHRPHQVLQAHDGKTSFFPFSYTAALAYSPDGRCLLTGSSDGVVMIFDTASGEPLFTKALAEEPDRAHAEGIVAVAWSPVQELIALAVLDGTVRIWRVEASPAS
jgi:eukaryotic-like serine/threonine-protein kinase